jgi:AmmeMemoRadiSam system protein B
VKSEIRKPAVAGQFYPADPEELRKMVGALLANIPPAAGPAPKAIIVPHAGYIYSGPIAASAYARFSPDREIIRRIVLLGPSHHVAFEGLAASSATAFATPLGLVAVDGEACHKLDSLPQVTRLDEAHAFEHSLEVQLPFLQVVLRDFAVVPLVIGEASAAEVAGVIDTLWGGPETRFVISSDLSHYHDAQTAELLDQATAKAIEALAPERIGTGQACGQLAIQGLLLAGSRRGLRARTLDLRNSGDTAGPRDRVVGYGAFELEESRLAGRGC